MTYKPADRPEYGSLKPEGRIEPAALKDLGPAELDGINGRIHSAGDAIRWAVDNLHPNLAKASSFGAEDSVLTDMITRICPDARFFTLDTGRLHPETYGFMKTVEERYNIKFEVVHPDAANVKKMVRENGLNLFYKGVKNRELCCYNRKVEPLQKKLATLDGWITGIRRDQTSTRQNASYVEIDRRYDGTKDAGGWSDAEGRNWPLRYNGVIKVNPLLEWTEEDVLRYIEENDVPYHPLRDKGYPSIGCDPCTRAIKPGEDPRAGRWWWESGNEKECGIHVAEETAKPSLEDLAGPKPGN